MTGVWCVRAEFGTYTKQFVDGGYVAIGWMPNSDLSRIKTRDVVSSVQFLSLDEQVAQIASEIARLPIGSALLNLAGRVARVKFPLPRDPLAQTPKFARKKVNELTRMIQSRPEFQSPTERTAARLRFEQRLVEHLHRIAANDESNRAAPPLVILPKCHDENELSI